MSTAFDRDLEEAIARMDSGPAEHPDYRADLRAEPEEERVEYARVRTMERDIVRLRRRLGTDRLLILLLAMAVLGKLAWDWLAGGAGFGL